MLFRSVPGWLHQLSVRLLVSAQVMISQFMSLSPASGSVLTAQSLEPASDSVSLCPSPARTLSLSKINKHWGAWVAQSVERPTSAQIMISRFLSSSPASGSVLTAQSLEPAWDSVSPLLSDPPLLMLCLS